MDIADWRKKIDEIDRQLVELINQRAEAARAIGRLKRHTNMPIYEPEREKIIFDNVRKINRGPLEHQDLIRVYERLIDVMRKIQKDEIVPEQPAAGGDTELESEVND
ncbi:MAG TPA: chorismate mutase [Terriglobales bacterium]|nr:chorismate mutase [Terriglobales bacterium]